MNQRVGKIVGIDQPASLNDGNKQRARNDVVAERHDFVGMRRRIAYKLDVATDLVYFIRKRRSPAVDDFQSLSDGRARLRGDLPVSKIDGGSKWST